MTTVKILGICGSHRHNGATEYSVKEALKAAETVPGVTTEFVALAGKKLSHCVHCNYCLKNVANCCIKDDYQEIYEKFIEADAYIIGTPVYEMSATPLLQDFLSRVRPTHIVHPGLLANRVGGALSTGGTRNGGQEAANEVIRHFYACYEILPVGGPGGNYTGACVWSQDRMAEGAKEDTVGMERVVGLGRRVAEAALLMKAGREALTEQGITFEETDFWQEKSELANDGVIK